MQPYFLTLCTLVLLGLGLILDLPLLPPGQRRGERVLFALLSLAALYGTLAWSYGWPWPDPTRITDALLDPLGRALLPVLE